MLISYESSSEKDVGIFDNICFLGDLTMEAGIKHMILHRESALMAIVLENRSMQIMDIVTQKIVRKFADIHKDQITDVAFSSDSRWLVTSSLDKTVKVWDVPSGKFHIFFINFKGKSLQGVRP